MLSTSEYVFLLIIYYLLIIIYLQTPNVQPPVLPAIGVAAVCRAIVKQDFVVKHQLARRSKRYFDLFIVSFS
jgi:hypothetical protein